MADTSSRKVIEYTADIRDVRKKMADLLRLQRQLARGATGELAGGYKKVGDSLNKISRTPVFKDINGQQKRLISQTDKTSQTVQGLDGKMVRVTTTTKKLGGATQSVTRSFQDVDKNTVSLGQNIARLAKRAVLTIPVWFALRTAITGTFSTIKGGLKTIAEQDKAFRKAQRNIEATTSSQSELNSELGNLKKETQALSLASGKSIEELTNAFQKFATVGFDAEASLAGMQYATKLAVAEFGDATETANAFARSMRVLIDRSEGAKSEAQQLAEAMALTDQLWQTNAFEVGEFTQNLLKFASVAKSANISTQETITLLATLSTGGLGNRAGRLLRTTILKALENLDEVAQSLNLNIDPAVDSTFDVILKLVDSLEQLSTSEKVPKELAGVLGELFSVRSTEVIASLKALKTTLKENANLSPDVAKLDKTFKDITESTGILVDRFHNVNKEIGKALVTGLVGGDNFNDSLKRIVGTLEELRKRANDVGKGFAGIFTGGPIGFLKNEFKDAFESLDDVSKASAEAGESAGAKFSKNYTKALKGNLNTTQIKDLIIEATTFGAEGLSLNPATFEASVKALKEQLEVEKQLSNENKKQEISVAKQTKGNKVLLEYAIERLRSAGALESTVLKTEKILSKQLGIEQDYEDKLQKQLDIQRQLNEEKRLQANLTSDSVKLFNIARDEGTNIAKKISEVLSGDVDFKSFVRRGGQAVEVFKKNFQDIFEQQQAKAFFSGEVVPDLKGLRGGAGITLPLEDEALQKSRSEIISKAKLEVTLAQKRLEIEQKINGLRNSAYQGLVSKSYVQPQQSASTSNPISPEAMANYNKIRFGTPTPFNQGGNSSSVTFSPNISLSINGQNAEDLNKRIDQTFEMLKNQAKDEIKKQLTGNSNPNIPL